MEQLTEAGRDDAAGRDDVRVQHRLDVRDGPTGIGDAADTRIGIVVDVETTGRNVASDSIIEMAVRRFRFDRSGTITHVDRSYRWLEDPGIPIPADIVAITGLTDRDVAGRAIDEDVAVRLLTSASLVIAHNAAFDRPLIERRLDAAHGLAWACSMTQIDWRSHGFDGRSLGYLLLQAGWFHDGHRADGDVDAVIQLLRHRFADGGTALSALAEAADRSSWLVRAVGASFDVKDALRDRGYRWDADRRVWWREVDDDARIAEEFWLAANVYAVSAGARSMGPRMERITAIDRFR